MCSGSPVYSISTSRNTSFLARKPILKKRSVSEVMLRRSLSNCTLVQQAVDSLSTRNYFGRDDDRPRLIARAESDYGPGSCSTPRGLSGSFSIKPTSAMSSGVQTPSVGKRHIHFSNKVEQCIAINKDIDDVDYTTKQLVLEETDESSDDGIIMMHGKSSEGRDSTRFASPATTAPWNHNTNKRTIAILPSTTLNCRSESPCPPEPTYDPIGNFWETGKRLLSHASSSETLRPSKSSSNFLLDEDEDIDAVWKPRNQTYNTTFPPSGPYYIRDQSDKDEEMESRGLRRTPSGMFMPYEGGNELGETGIVGRVLDTVNTARDIAHVIWNVGWRR
jgi:hypothetical protein